MLSRISGDCFRWKSCLVHFTTNWVQDPKHGTVKQVVEDSKLVSLLVRFFVECVWSTTAWRTTKFMERHKFIKQKQMELLKLPLISPFVDSTTLSAGPLLRGSGCPVHRVSRVNPKGRFRDATWKSKRAVEGNSGIPITPPQRLRCYKAPFTVHPLSSHASLLSNRALSCALIKLIFGLLRYARSDACF